MTLWKFPLKIQCCWLDKTHGKHQMMTLIQITNSSVFVENYLTWPWRFWQILISSLISLKLWVFLFLFKNFRKRNRCKTNLSKNTENFCLFWKCIHVKFDSIFAIWCRLCSDHLLRPKIHMQTENIRDIPFQWTKSSIIKSSDIFFLSGFC